MHASVLDPLVRCESALGRRSYLLCWPPSYCSEHREEEEKMYMPPIASLISELAGML